MFQIITDKNIRVEMEHAPDGNNIGQVQFRQMLLPSPR